MSTKTPPTAERLFTAVRELAPLVAADQPKLDSARELTPTLSGAIVESVLFRFWIPEELGGARSGCNVVVQGKFWISRPYSQLSDQERHYDQQ